MRSDPDLQPDPANGPHAVLWTAHPEKGREAWLDWSQGNVFTTNPDSALFTKMLQIARDLEAWIQGDAKEVYESVQEFRDREWALNIGDSEPAHSEARQSDDE